MENDLAQAELTVARAKADLAEADVLAPFDGVVTQQVFTEKSVVPAQTTILVLSSLSWQVTGTIDEADAGRMSVGQPVGLVASGPEGQVITAEVASLAPSPDFAKTRAYTVLAMPNAQGGQLQNGLNVQVETTSATTAKAVFVPAGAIATRDGKTVVFVVTDGKAAMHEVKAGPRDGAQVEVDSGVAAGQSVIVDPPTSLVDGTVVTPVATPTQP